MTPPPIDETAWAADRNMVKSDRQNQLARTYGEKVMQVAVEQSCHCVDTWSILQGSSERRGDFLSDGLHLNEEGNRRVFEGLMDLLKFELPALAPMDDSDGEGKHGKSGIPVEEKLWKELCSI